MYRREVYRAKVRGARLWTRRRRTPFRVATSSLRPRPSVFIVGAQKSGTSSLYSYLVQHGAIGRPRVKEPRYFTENQGRSEGWYRGNSALFASMGIDATPEYLFYPTVAERVLRFEPEARVIALLRDPAERAFSHYRHMVRLHVEPLGFAEALDAEEHRLGLGWRRARAGLDPGPSFNRYSYAARGLYKQQLDRWFGAFPREQILLLRSADLNADPAGTLRTVASFLDVEPPSLDLPYPAVHVGQSATVDRGALERLQESFERPNEALLEAYGVDL